MIIYAMSLILVVVVVVETCCQSWGVCHK